MFRKALLTIALLADVSSYALAQGSASHSTSQPNTWISVLPTPLTETQVKSRLEREGYSNVSLSSAIGTSASSLTGSGGDSITGVSPSGSRPMWIGTAIKEGKQVNISVAPDSTVYEGSGTSFGASGSIGISR
jgi:hypothetical protein